MEAVIIKTEKRLDVGRAPALEQKLMELLDAGNKEIILDMEDTHYISSMALRAILKVLKRVKTMDGSLVLRHVSQTVMEVFEVTNFASILTFEENE